MMIGLINNKNINLFIAVVLWFGRLVFVDAAENMYEPTPAHPDFQSVSFEEIQSALRELRVAPRLLLTDKMLADVHSKLETDNYWFKYYIALKAFAGAVIVASNFKKKIFTLFIFLSLLYYFFKIDVLCKRAVFVVVVDVCKIPFVADSKE